MSEEKIPVIGLLRRGRGFILRDRNLSFDFNNIDETHENYNDNDHTVNGIPCPQNGETVEAKAIIASCVICHVNQIQTVNFPCMHACFCLNCARPALQYSSKCPQCRNKYMHVSMLYLSYKDVNEVDNTSKQKKSRKKIDDSKIDDQEDDENRLRKKCKTNDSLNTSNSN
jgi:hypothetical protein